MKDIILWTTAAISLAFALVVYRKYLKYEKANKILRKNFTCKYNDKAGCNELCCSYCPSRKECDWCCGGDPKHCDGFSKE